VTVKVSAIVPVYNPGRNIDDCIATLVDQSLPPDEYEVIFVDDGSTDETPARLDELAAKHPHVRVEHIPNSGWPGRPRNVGTDLARGEFVYFVDDGSTDETPARLDELAAKHPHVRVEHIPNSGWPGRPRNVGTDLARGEFVYFVDNDDWVGHEALERLYERAVADRADIVLGKVVGHGLGKKVANGIFRENRSDVTLDWQPLLWLLTPHKLFRKPFLDEHGIRFPEGRRRLEDHIFVVHAYFHAARISVLADYTCYHWVLRDLDENASTQRFDPVSYYGNVREVLDLVDEHTEPGSRRDRLYLHWYRGKLLGRVGSVHFLNWDPGYRRARYDEVHRLTLERFHPRIDALLPLNLRVRSRLVRDDAYDALIDLADRESRLRAGVRVVDVRRDGEDLMLALEASLVGGGGLVTFERSSGRLRWRVPDGLPLVASDDLDATEELARAHAYVVVRSMADRSDFALPGEQEVRMVPVEGRADVVRPVVAATVRVSARTGAAGAPLRAGDWEIVATPTIAGFKSRGLARRRAGGDQLVVRVGEDGRLAEIRPPLRRRVSRRFPRLARVARRARAHALRRGQ
jgi:poly(ribitol-phosphate) beta-N-acetylglucosaminyltransferase